MTVPSARAISGRPASLERKTEALRKSEVFSRLEEQELELVAGHSRLYRYREGERIFEEGEPGDALFVVVDGAVRILKGQEGEGGSVMAELVSGDTFGELELFNSSRRNAAAEAAGDAIVLAFPGRGIRFESVLARHPEFSADLLFASMRVIAGRIRRANALIKDNSPWVQEVRRQVYGDKLTGLYNRTYLEENLSDLLERSSCVALLMFKPDNFKLINDNYGHEAGDTVLRLMAVELRRAVDGEVLLARYMGNELAVVLPDCGVEQASEAALTIRAALNRLDLEPITGTGDIRLTASFGVAVFPTHAGSAEELIEAAHGLPLLGRARGGNLVLFPEDAAGDGSAKAPEDLL